MIKKKLQIDGYTYYYAINTCEKGEIDPILIVNGSFQSMKSWGKVVRKFEGRATTIIADLPGWGEADFLPEHVDFTIHARAINQIVKAESIQKINIFSSSYGTPVAISFARNYPSSVSNMVLASPIFDTGHTDVISCIELTSIIDRGDKDELVNFLMNLGLMNNQQGKNGNINNFDIIKSLFVRQLNTLNDDKLDKFVSNTQRILNEGDFTMKGIGHIRMLSFTGEHDEFTTPKVCLKAALRFTQGHFTTIKEADHLFTNEQMDTTCELLEKFFSESDLQDVEGCGSIFSMQDDNPRSRRTLKRYTNEVEKKQPLVSSIVMETNNRSWMSRASSLFL